MVQTRAQAKATTKPSKSAKKAQSSSTSSSSPTKKARKSTKPKINITPPSVVVANAVAAAVAATSSSAVANSKTRMEVGAKAGVARGRNASTDAKTTRKVRGIPPPHAKVVKATSPLKSSLQKAPRRGMRKAAPAKDVKVKDTLNDEVGYKQRSEKEVENGEDELHENINDVKARKGEEEEEDRERGKKKIGGAAKGKGDAKADNAGAGLRSAHTARTAGKADSKDATATLKKGTANTSAKDKKTTATRLPGETRLKRKQPLSSADAHAKTPEAVSVSGSAKNTCPAPKRQKTTDVAAPTAASARTTTASSRVRAKAGASTASQPVTKTTNTSSRTPASATKTIKAGSARAAKPLSLLQSAPRRSPVKQAQRLREPARSPVRKSPVRSQQVSPIKMAMSVETPLMKSKCGIEAGGLDFDKKSSNSETGLVAAEGDETVIENDIIDAEWEDMRNIDFRGDSVKRSPEKMLEALTAEDCSSPSPAKSVMSVQSTKSHRSIMSAKSLRFEVMEMGAYEEVRETRVTEEIKVVEDKEVSIAEELVKPEKLEEKETVVEENDIEDNVASPAPVTNTPATHASMPTPRPITPASTYKPTLLSKTPKFPAQSSSSSLFSNIKRMNNPPATAPQIRASSAAINNKMSNNNASTTPSSMMSPSRLLSGAASFIKAPFESVSITPFKAAPPVSRQTSASRSLFESIMRAPTEEREMFPISPTPKDVVSPEAEDDTETSEEDEDVPQTPCTAPQTATPAAMSTVKPTVVTPAMGAAPLRRNLLMTEPPVARPILKSAMKMPASVAPTRRLAFVDENVAAEFSDGERERLAAGSPIQKSAVKVVTFQTPATARKRREQQPSVNVYDDEHDMYNDETVNSMISNHQILEGAVFFVDVNSAEGADAGDLFIPLLTELGATCVPRWQNSLEGVTHVLFKDGQRRTLEKVSDSDGRIKCVNLGWALDCERYGKWMDEAGYAVDLSQMSRSPPKALMNVNVNNTPTTITRTPTARKSTSAAAYLAPTPKFLATPTAAKAPNWDKENIPTPDTDHSQTTPYFLHKEELVQKTCPPKQMMKPMFGGQNDPLSFKEKLNGAKRKSMYCKPMLAASPVKRAPGLF